MRRRDVAAVSSPVDGSSGAAALPRRRWQRWLCGLAFFLCAVTTPAGRAAETVAYPGESLYQIHPALTDQTGKSLSLDRYAGKPAVVSMFYASCPNICPALVDTILSAERKLAAEGKPLPPVLLVSFDDVHDTPAVLAAIAEKRHLDLERWTLARASASDVRLLAAALGIQYRRLPDETFSHATLITLLDARGVPFARTTKLGEPEPAFVDALRRAP